MNGTRKVQVVIVGGGSIAPFHAKYFVSSSACDLVGIIDPFSSSLAEQLSVGSFKSVAELLSSISQQPDLYIICVPSGLHVKLATEVLEAAEPKAILVEKPLATKAASGQTLLALAESKGCTIVVGHHRRFHPAIKAAKQTIIAGGIGKVTAISGFWTCKKNGSYFDVAWRTSRSGGGGPIWTNFVHDIDLLHYMVGSNVVRVWVTPTVNRRVHEVKSGDGVEEGTALMFQFGNGAVGTFIVSDNVASPFGWESASGDSPLYPKTETAVDCFRILGTEGTLTVPDGNLWTYSEDDAREKGLEIGWHVPMKRTALVIADSIPFQDQAEHLCRVASGKEKPVCSGSDGLMAVKVCEAIIKALDRGDGSPVDIK